MEIVFWNTDQPNVVEARLTLRRTQVTDHDYTFNSPSTAAGVMLGRSANGRVEWKDATGRTLKDLQTAASASGG